MHFFKCGANIGKKYLFKQWAMRNFFSGLNIVSKCNDNLLFDSMVEYELSEIIIIISLSSK